MAGLRPGRRIAGLRVEDRVGHGGAGEVYRLRDAATGRAYALKVVVRGDPRAIEREYEALRRLDHPGFVRAIDLVDVGGCPGLLLEWIDGPPLGRWVRETRPGLPEGAALLDDACDALAHAHARGVFHRDLKPGNLLLQRGADGWRLRVADLGLARGQAGPVEVGLGTPGYMAPERLHGAPGDARSDVFGLGCLAYLLATGTPPFGGADRRAVWNAADRGRRRPVAEAAPDLDPAWVEVIEACLAPDPWDRPADAGVLRELVAGCPPVRRVRSRLGWEREDWDDDLDRARRRAWLAGETSGWGGIRAALGDVVTPAGAPGGPRRPVARRIDPRAATVPRPPDRVAPDRRKTWAIVGATIAVLAALALALWSA